MDYYFDGYGFSCYDVSLPDFETMLKFIKKHRFENNIKDLESVVDDSGEIIDKSEFDAIIYDYEDERGSSGFWSIFADIVSNETELEIMNLSSDFDQAVILLNKPAWDYNDKEKILTYDGLKEIFSKYLSELGIDEFQFGEQVIAGTN